MPPGAVRDTFGTSLLTGHGKDVRSLSSGSRTHRRRSNILTFKPITDDANLVPGQSPEAKDKVFVELIGIFYEHINPALIGTLLAVLSTFLLLCGRADQGYLKI